MSDPHSAVDIYMNDPFPALVVCMSGPYSAVVLDMKGPYSAVVLSKCPISSSSSVLSGLYPAVVLSYE